jgi:hypothetical protein
MGWKIDGTETIYGSQIKSAAKASTFGSAQYFIFFVRKNEVLI